MSDFFMNALKTISGGLTRLESFSPYLSLKYLIWDRFINNQEKLISESLSSINNRLTSHVVKPDNLPLEEELEGKLSKNGSDKSTRHNYHQIYGPLIRNLAGNILEIGIGSKSNRSYASGEPGGGLVSFFELNADLNLFGADIDPKAAEDVSFPVYLVDQTKEESIKNLIENLKSFERFAMIIDDGYHEFSANERTFTYCRHLVREGGTYIIEDIHESHIELWNVFINLHNLNAQILDLRKFRPKVRDNILVVINL